MSNQVTTAWLVPSVTPGTCLRATASLPQSHIATLLNTSYMISGFLEKIKKRSFLKNRGGSFTNYGPGVRGPAEDSDGSPFPCPAFPRKKRVCSPWVEERTLHWVLSLILRSTPGLRKCPSLEGGETWAGNEPASMGDCRLANKRPLAEGWGQRGRRT